MPNFGDQILSVADGRDLVLDPGSENSVYITHVSNPTSSVKSDGINFVPPGLDDIPVGIYASLKFKPPLKCGTGVVVSGGEETMITYFIA